MDLESRLQWVDYPEAKDAMFEQTDIEQAPWYLVEAVIATRARLNGVGNIVSLVPYDDLTPAPIELPRRTENLCSVCPPGRDRHIVPDDFGLKRKSGRFSFSVNCAGG